VNSLLQKPVPAQNNTTYKHEGKTSMPSAGFEPATPATKRLQTYVLDRAATGIGNRNTMPEYLITSKVPVKKDGKI
jgi:hypothetical protein